MAVGIFIAGLAGLTIGAMAMAWRQRRKRQEELRHILKLMECVIEGNKLAVSDSGQETMTAKLTHQLVRIQEIVQGKVEHAEKNRDEIQKLISEIAHQMRTPLTNIETYAGFLRESLEKKAENGDLDMENSYVSAIEESERKLYFLVESFIKMSRLEQHIIQIRKEAAYPAKTVQNALGQIQSRAELKKIQFTVNLLPEAQCPHDANWLGEAIYNILDNAVKYSEMGGEIEVSMRETEMFLKIRVRDYGIGIQAGEENHIFQRFYRGKNVTTQEGFGIGLYLAREIINLHSGFVVVRRMRPGVQLEVSLPR